MVNVIVPKAGMLTKKQVEDPRNKWHFLGSNKWRYDTGLQDYLDCLIGRTLTNNLFEHKRNKTLQDLIIYASETTATGIAKYYEFPHPERFRVFVLWVYNNVAPGNGWVYPKLEQMDYFPYEDLHETFVERFIEIKEVVNG